MRAHFGDVVSPTGNCPSVAIAAQSLEQEQNEEPAEKAAAVDLQTRVSQFRADSGNMTAVNEFVDEVLLKAEAEALKLQLARNGPKIAQPKEKSRQSFVIPDFKNGKVVNRARGLVVRLFDAICNCANNAAAPAQRMKLRGKRAASMANGSASAAAAAPAGSSNASETEKLAKKQQQQQQSLDSGRDKKENEKKKKREEVELLQQQQQHDDSVQRQ